MATDLNDVLAFVNQTDNLGLLQTIAKACENRYEQVTAKLKADEKAARESEAALARKQREFDQKVADGLKQGEKVDPEPNAVPPQDLPESPEVLQTGDAPGDLDPALSGQAPAPGDPSKPEN